MRTTVTVDDALLAKAAEFDSVKEKSTLLARHWSGVESARRLAASAAPTSLPRRRAGRRPGDPGRHSPVGGI